MTTYKNIRSRAEVNVKTLNKIFAPLTFEERIQLLYRYFRQEDVLYTSSFGTKSVFLLHLISRIRPSQKVHFINTGFNFPQTLAYKEELTELFGLQVEDIIPDPTQHQFSIDEKAWKTAPDLCCAINKVAALDPIKEKHKVWISGLMAYQTNYRSELEIFEEQDGIIKFHPLIDIDEGEFLYHLSYYGLPKHPLEAFGYGSIGCTHCTVKGKGREGRWKGKTKTECGLHPSRLSA
ncbi:MAG: phosphoadenylyl-sulfate reductase [Chitinophagales bacterium]|nr:phosphoadenylyl-sulfate reductase [Chitinophagales bacterium]